MLQLLFLSSAQIPKKRPVERTIVYFLQNVHMLCLKFIFISFIINIDFIRNIIVYYNQ